MGEFRFRLPSDWRLEDRQASSIHVIGLDGVPWPCRVFTEGHTLVIHRNRDESGRTYLSCPFPRYGELTVCTGTLPERPEPYDLLTELSRGTLNRLRNQISIWQEGRFEVPPPILEKTAEATRILGDAIMADRTESRDRVARQSLDLAMEALFDLCGNFGNRIARLRLGKPETFPPFWMVGRSPSDDPACSLSRDPYTGSCLARPDVWRPEHGVEGDGESQGQQVLGPLLDASPMGMSEALIRLDDFEARRSKILSGAREVARRAPADLTMVHVVSGLNGLGHRHLGYPQQLRITTDLLGLVEEQLPDVPTMVSFDFPWAERMASSVGGIHPLQIADTLLRQGARLSYLGLDINLDYWPLGSVSRDPLQWIDLVDVWSQLGLPLVLIVRIPFGTPPTADPAEGRPLNTIRKNMTDPQRESLVRTVLPLMVARPAVQGLIYAQWSDRDDTRFPCGGLVGVDGARKPSADLLEELDAGYLRLPGGQ